VPKAVFDLQWHPEKKKKKKKEKKEGHSDSEGD